MFAKLKKKIAEEGGGTPPTTPIDVRQKSPGPGVTSPVSPPAGKGPGVGVLAASPLPSNNYHSNQEDITKDEVLGMLVKRTDQVKSLETKISDLASTIKEKNKEIDKLQTSLSHQQQGLDQKMAGLEEDFRAKSAQVTDSFTQALAKKDDNWKIKLADKEKECDKLRADLVTAEQYRSKYVARTEETEELEGLTTQELAKLKHMLLNKEEAMTAIQKQLAEAQDAMTTSEQSLTTCQQDNDKMKKQLDDFAVQKKRLEEENNTHYTSVLSLRQDKETLHKQLQHTSDKLNKSLHQLNVLEQQSTDLENDHKTLQRNYDIYKNKTTLEIAEKASHIEHFEERVKILEQRLKDTELNVDERATALLQERTGLENRLDETRAQLVEVKTTWSTKITQLEAQIAHLNTVIAEDREELSTKDTEISTMKDNFELQLASVKAQQEAAEKQLLLGNERLDEKDALLDKQRLSLENELLKHEKATSGKEAELREKMDSREAELRGQIDRLKEEISKLQQSLQAERKSNEEKLTNLQSSADEFLEREIEAERQMTSLEDGLQTSKAELKEKTRECGRLTSSMAECARQNQQLETKLSAIERDLSSLRDHYESLDRKYKTKCTELVDNNAELDKLMLRNAELSQHCEHLKKKKVPTATLR